MPYSTEYKNAMLDAVPPDALSLHSALPGSAGASEITGGTPAYARKTPTWSAAVNGAKALAAPVTFDVPASTTVAYVGLWRGGAWRGYIPITNQTFNNQGTLTLTSGSIDLNATASA